MQKIVIYLLVGYCFYYVVKLVYKGVLGKEKSCCSGCTSCPDETAKKNQ